jgi:hypothetical protein
MGRQKVRSVEEVDVSDGMTGREPRGSSAAGGGGGRENRNDESRGGELYVALGELGGREHIRSEARDH